MVPPANIHLAMSWGLKKHSCSQGGNWKSLGLTMILDAKNALRESVLAMGNRFVNLQNITILLPYVFFLAAHSCLRSESVWQIPCGTPPSAVCWKGRKPDYYWGLCFLSQIALLLQIELSSFIARSRWEAVHAWSHGFRMHCKIVVSTPACILSESGHSSNGWCKSG
jgi:hypothetical protein